MLSTTIAMAALAGCGGATSQKPTYRDNSAEVARIAAQIPVQFPAVRNVAMRVEVPGLPAWRAAAGKARPDGPAMSPDQPFRSASVGKMVMAATVLRLVEDGKVKLDGTLDAYLAPEILNGLHVLDGVDRSRQITVRQLLNHTSGLADYFEDGPTGDAEGLSPFKRELLANPSRLWTPEEPIQWAKSHLAPRFAPGQGFHYSETGYQLLGLVVQRASGQSLQDAYRKYVFGPLRMDRTSLEWREPNRATLPLAACFEGDLDLTDLRALSSEWGGGGLVTTAEDLARFLHGLFEGRLFRRADTLAKMKETSPQSDHTYALGLMRLNLDGTPAWGHLGHYATWAIYDPTRQVAYTGTLNQATAADSLPLILAATQEVVRDAEK
jgi:D-alanyl-D-alanine carboxypeptidase